MAGWDRFSDGVLTFGARLETGYWLFGAGVLWGYNTVSVDGSEARIPCSSKPLESA